ncbi:MAG: glycyl-radical enzyme activating protein [Ruminococcaceae bacterium]|nr:glycyl-radical enzyme activating protein [Oscillospiraceae bacterium]
MTDKGKIFNVQRFSIHDGPGIRTTVFLKGCPLHCVWCHNPESHINKPEIMLEKDKCVNCGACVMACTAGVHKIEMGVHILDNKKCIGCKSCAEICPAAALELCGYEESAEAVLETVLRDKAFYRKEGGLTVSGGEPLSQSEFTLELLKMAKEAGITTCIETSGYGKWENLEKLIPYTDLFLYDFKIADSSLHKKYTGVDNTLIIENLKNLDKMGAKTVLRCPIIPDINDNKEHFDGILKLSNELENITEINLEPYHPLGISKLERLNKDCLYDNKEFMDKEKLKSLAESLVEKAKVKVKIM